MSIVVIEGGRRITIEGGHQPQFMYGLDANKSTSPGIGDTYYAKDTLRSYKCFVVGTWRWEWTGMSSGIRFTKDQMTIVKGAWAVYTAAGQGDVDFGLVGAVGAKAWENDPNDTDLDEVKISNLNLLAGTYLIEIVGIKATTMGITEILHGTTSIGTVNMGNAGVVYNVINKFYYTITSNTTADFRVRVNGTTGAFYGIAFSRLEITKVSNSPVITTLPPTAANDAGAATAGVPIGGLYRTNADPSVLMIRAV